MGQGACRVGVGWDLAALLHVYGNRRVNAAVRGSNGVRFEWKEIQMLTFISIGSRPGKENRKWTLYCRAGSIHFSPHTHTYTHSEVMIWLIKFLLSAEALLTWETGAPDLLPSSHEECLNLREMSKEYLDQPSCRGTCLWWDGGGHGPGLGALPLVWCNKANPYVVRVCWLWHSCCHKQGWVSAEWVYLFSKSHQGLDIFSMLAGSSQGSPLAAVKCWKNQAYTRSRARMRVG